MMRQAARRGGARIAKSGRRRGIPIQNQMQLEARSAEPAAAKGEVAWSWHLG